MTAVGALAHLIVHSRWLSLITTVFPALAASLHGALAQSETYRLHATSERVALELQNAVVEIQRSLDAAVADEGDVAPAVVGPTGHPVTYNYLANYGGPYGGGSGMGSGGRRGMGTGGGGTGYGQGGSSMDGVGNAPRPPADPSKKK